MVAEAGLRYLEKEKARARSIFLSSETRRRYRGDAISLGRKLTATQVLHMLQK